MEKKYYANFESQKLESLEELKVFYEQDKGNDEDYWTFSEWLEACMSYNNGALDEVEKIDKSYFETLVKDRKINQETCDFWTSLNTEIYKTKDDDFYTLDGQHYAFGIENLKINLPMLDDYCRKHKIEWNFSHCGKLVNIGGRLYPYLKTLSDLYDDDERLKVEIDGNYYYFG